METLNYQPVEPKDLEMFGLSNYEAKTYLSLLSMGQSTAKSIIDSSNVPSGRVYDVLTSLESKGLVERQDSYPKRYIAMDPKIAVKRLLEAKSQEFQFVKEKASLIESELSQLYNSPTEESAFWSVAMDQEGISKFSQKLLEAEQEVLIYLNMTLTHAMDSSSENLSLFMETLKNLIGKGVEIKLIMGGIGQETFKENFIEYFMPYYDVIKNTQLRFTNNLTNTFDVVDKEKVLLKMSNPVDPTEYLASIFLWKKDFAEKLRARFFDLWQNADELEVKIG